MQGAEGHHRVAPSIGFGAHWSWIWLGRDGSPGEYVSGQGFDIGWFSVRSKACFGVGAHAGRGAGRQAVTILFSVSFLKAQTGAPG